MKLTDLSSTERNAVIIELAERMVDIVTVNSHVQAEETLEKLGDEDLQKSKDGTFTINYVIRMSYGDILQVISRSRRENRK